MGFRFTVILLLVLVAAKVTESSASPTWDAVSRFSLADFDSGADLKVGDIINEDEEGMMDSEASRRVLAGRRYVGYSALRRNDIPCNRRGVSYYNCQQRSAANPYRRGCSQITRCARV